MREIKFRAWFDGEMHSHEDLVDMDQETHAVYTILTHKVQVGGDAFMQYTEFKDKNGREIYEGDILKDASPLLKTVIFHEGMYGCKIKRRKSFYSEDLVEICYPLLEYYECDENIEVIGNIYENPELLGTAHE